MIRLRNVALLWAIALSVAVNAASAADVESTSRHTEYMVEMRDGVKLATSVYLPSGTSVIR